MKLYLIKRAGYKLQPYNLLGVFTSRENEIVGALAFFKKKEAKKYIERINSKLPSPIKCKIITVEVKERRL